MQENKHSVILEQKKNLSVSGVDSVSSFSEAKIVLTLIGGERMSIIGSDLKIVGFSKTNGSFTAEGTVLGLSYGGKSLVSKIFK
ncbi:MAG: sporulation protein [Clostridia bacterium]|nr:sporulation protein [Clostridia bacterium]